jgi:ketosteroid isomerase-like protein
MIAAAACRGQPGAGFSGASLLAPPPEEEAAHDELLRADLGRADSVGRLGLADGLSSTFADDIIYLRGGLPILRGRAAAHAVVAAESIGTGAAVRWQPVRAETSRDRASGYTYGYAIYGLPQAGATSVRIDRYIAFWRKTAVGWRIAGYAETSGTPPTPLVPPAAAVAGVVADVPMSRTRSPVDVIRMADTDFSRDATRLGTGEAFGRYAAEDAQIFSPLGEFVTGPGAITASFSAPIGKSSFAWHPVEGEMAKSGDLGFTVGNAVFTSEREDGTVVARYSKYLTVWKRQRDGAWRYVVDGGSARPGPADTRPPAPK